MTSIKVMVIGAIGVGKTSLVRRLIDDRFQDDYGPTLGVDLYSYIAKLDDVPGTASAELAIWDTDGEFGEGILVDDYMNGAEAALIVGDVTRHATLDHMLQLAAGFQDTLPGKQFYYVLNKIDLIPEDSVLDLPEDLVDSDNLINTSAKTGANVRKAFHDTAATYLRRNR